MVNGTHSLNRYGFAVAAVGVAFGLTWLLPGVRGQTPSLFLFTAVVAAAWYGGLRAGLLAAVLAVLALDWLLPGVARATTPLLRSVLESGHPVVNVEVGGRSADRPGEFRHWLTTVYPVRTADGALLGLGTVVTEITERKRWEAALAERARLA